MELENLRQECLNCRRCGLCDTRTNVVFGQGVPTAEVTVSYTHLTLPTT